jgi:hypothetical protein
MALTKVRLGGFEPQYVGRRNLVINGAMKVAQRGTSETGISTSGYYTVDRMRIASGNTAGRFTMTQESITDLSGFANAVKLDCTTADTSIASNELVTIGTRIEGQDLQQLKKGTSDAEKVTVSFYVKGNASATYVLELYDADNTRQVSKTFSVTTSWNRVSLTFDGDTTGAFTDDNNLSLLLQIWLHAGSDYTSGTLSTSWSSVTGANRVVGISSFFDSTDRTFFLTGLQMEIGEQATPFEHRSFGEELQLCSRYFQKYTGEQQEWIYNEGNGATLKWWQLIFPNGTMRSSPSMSFSSGWTGGSAAGLSGTVSSMSCTTSPNRASCRTTFSATGGSAYNIHHCDSFADDECFMDAEL